MKKKILTAACLSMFFLIGCNKADLKKTYVQEIEINISKALPNEIGINLRNNQASTEETADISFMLNEKGFIVAIPKNGATGIYLKTLNQYNAGDIPKYFEECLQHESEFLSGSKPVTSEGDIYCWKTTDGIYALVIKKIALEQKFIKITILTFHGTE